VLRRAIKLFSGAYFQRMPLEYAIYRDGALSRRTIVRADRATWAWRFA
jgi:hypothetical protein